MKLSTEIAILKKIQEKLKFLHHNSSTLHLTGQGNVIGTLRTDLCDNFDVVLTILLLITYKQC